jgi:hypothetical protein
LISVITHPLNLSLRHGSINCKYEAEVGWREVGTGVAPAMAGIGGGGGSKGTGTGGGGMPGY